ncbi:MAG: hypothetical protein WC489_08750 [Patescibacteria group bacterium]|jgi:hypothetical protein
MAAKDKGLQDRQADELNTPVEDGLEADSDIISSRDRDVFLKQYQEHERSELRDQGFDEDEIRAILGEDTEDETEKAGEPGGEQGKEEKEEVGEGEGEGGDDEKSGDEAEKGEGGEDEKEGSEGEDQSGGGKPAEDAAEKKEAEHRELKPEEILQVKIPVKIDGKDGEVTIAELQKSYQVQGHLTRQLQQVAAYKQQLDNVGAQLQAKARELDEQFKEYEEQLFTPEEVQQRKARRDREQAERGLQYQNLFMQCRNTLYQRHPDADNLDYDPDFVDFRAKNMPFLNEQLLNNYGPGVFFPAMDIAMSYYKDVKKCMEALQQAQDATTSFKKEREAELAKREKEQRAEKKKAKDVKPSTVDAKKGGDEDDEAENPASNRDYVRSLAKKRLAAQGL